MDFFLFVSNSNTDNNRCVFILDMFSSQVPMSSLPSEQKGPAYAEKVQSQENPLGFSLQFPPLRHSFPQLLQCPRQPGSTPGVTLALSSRSRACPFSCRARRHPRKPLCLVAVPPEREILQMETRTQVSYAGFKDQAKLRPPRELQKFEEQKYNSGSTI